MSAVLLLVAVLPGDCYARQQFVSSYAYPIYQQQIIAPLTYYSAGQNLVEEAFVERVARRVAELQLQQQPIKSSIQAPFKQQQQIQAPSPIQAPKPIQAPLQAPLKSQGQQISGSVLSLKCARCHSGPNPKKGIVIDGQTPMFPDQIIKAIQQVNDNKMPFEGPPLTSAEKNQALNELLALHSRLPPEPITPIPEPEPELRPRQDSPIRRESGDLQ